MHPQVTLVPHDYDLLKAMPRFDGLFLSNGPGDPTLAGQYSYHITLCVQQNVHALVHLLRLLTQCTQRVYSSYQCC